MARSKSLLLMMLMLVATTALAKSSPAPTAPGKYTGWGPDIDQIEIVRPFRFADYTSVVVEPLDVGAVPKPTDNDVIDAAEKALDGATSAFAGGLGGELKKDVKVETAGAEKGEGTLLVRGRITLNDPGSRAKRIFVGFGAGGSRGAIEGEIVDAATGQVLLRFSQERHSGFEHFTGYREIMLRNFAAIGSDVGRILERF